MTYINPQTGVSMQTNAQSLRELHGLLRYLNRCSASHGWVKLNGVDGVQRLARAIRARLFQERQPMVKWAYLLNRLDPPRCRCGKPGTRIYGSVTFCVRCGPPQAIRAIQAKGRQAREDAASQFHRDRLDQDTRDLSRIAYRRNSRMGSPGPFP